MERDLKACYLTYKNGGTRRGANGVPKGNHIRLFPITDFITANEKISACFVLIRIDESSLLSGEITL